MTNREGEHAFSIELCSREHLKSIKLGDDQNEQVFIEGFLGKLSELKLVEESMLEVRGRNGTLRLDLTADELKMHTGKLKGRMS